MIREGVHVKLISTQLGHSSIAVTMDRYGHLLDGSYADASGALEQAVFGSTDVAAGAAQADR